MQQPVQAKITQKMLLRSAIGIFALAALVLAFRWYKGQESDPQGNDIVSGGTAGWVAAIETTDAGSQAVAFKPDGTMVVQGTVPTNSEDKDLAWRPDGNDLFFASNRQKEKFTIFRWCPDAGHSAEMRSLEGLPQGNPSFLTSDAAKGDDAQALITAGGRVMSLDARKPSLLQILPPPGKRALSNPDDLGAGNGGPFEGIYERLGDSFKTAKWMPDKGAVVAIMRGEAGEVLIYQRLNYTKPEEAQPQPIIGGDKIYFDVDQNSGKIYFTVQNFRWLDPSNIPPEFVVNNKATTPFRHAVCVIDMKSNTPLQPLAISKDDKVCFGSLAISPAGDTVAVVGGAYKGNGNFEPAALVVGPTDQNLAKSPAVAGGAIFEPSWAPDGKKIAYSVSESKTSRAIFILEPGSGPRRLSPTTGRFGNPIFSPQKAAP